MAQLLAEVANCVPFRLPLLLLCSTAGEPHVAGGDLFLCPTVRLLADTPLPPGGSGSGADTGGDGGGPGEAVYEYDGAGHRLVLPDKGHLGELVQGCVGG